jgi:hypothetical protein
MVNVALDAPAGTVTDPGTRSAVVLLETSDTVIPPLAAGPLSLAVPVADRLPVIDGGLTEIVLSAIGLSVIVVEREALPSVARTVYVTGAVTKAVAMLIVPIALPTGIVIEAGKGNVAASPPESDTTDADPCAAPFKVTVSLRTVPPEAERGLKATDATCSGATLTEIALVTPP